MRAKRNQFPKVSDEISSVITEPIKRKSQIRIRFRRSTGTRTVETTIEYFLASLCDLQPLETEIRLGLRHSSTPEVSNLLRKLSRCRLTATDISRAHPNAILSVLKEVFTSLPSIFENEEFISLAKDTPQDLFICYLNGLMDSISPAERQIAYLLCRSLQNLVDLSSSRRQSLTDVLMVFTPLLFPRCEGAIESFLRATRAVLIMIEESQFVFKKHIIMYEGKSMFEDLVESLNHLEASFHDSTFEDKDISISEDEYSDDDMASSLTNSQYYYTLAYLDID